MSDVDPAAIMAEHDSHADLGCGFVYFTKQPGRCLPYVLAEALYASEAALIEMTRTAQKRERERDKFFRDLADERAKVAELTERAPWAVKPAPSRPDHVHDESCCIVDYPQQR